jgi:hypothetical protein
LQSEFLPRELFQYIRTAEYYLAHLVWYDGVLGTFAIGPGKALGQDERNSRRSELAMPRRRRLKVNRIAIPAAELASKIVERVRELSSCSKLRGVEFVFVGSCGQEPNWFARPLPSRVSDDCMREFVAALACVRREFDLQLET